MRLAQSSFPVSMLFVLIFASVIGGCAVSVANAQVYGYEEVASSGDPAPGTGGGIYSTPLTPALNNAGDVAFWSTVAGGTTASGIFVASGETHRAAALIGETAPDTGGGTYFVFLSTPAIDDSGRVVFSALVQGGSVSRGLFADVNGSDAVVALAGGSAPGTGGATYSTFTPPRLSGSGDIVFGAFLSGGTSSQGIFMNDGTVTVAVAVTGEAAPDTGGGTFLGFGLVPPSLDDTGCIVFNAQIAGGSVPAGLFRDCSGTQEALVIVGDAAPGTGGGTFASFTSPGLSPASNSRVDVAFVGEIVGGTADRGIFRLKSGVLTAIALEGDSVPEVAGATFDDLSCVLPQIAGMGLNQIDRAVVFGANLAGAGPSRGIFVHWATTLWVVLEGTGGPGGTVFTDFSCVIAFNNARKIAFAATASGSPGIFLASGVPSVPALPASLRIVAWIATALLARRRLAAVSYRG